MSNSSITVNNKKLATDQITEDSQTKEVQRVKIEGSAAAANGVAPEDSLFSFLNIRGGSSTSLLVDGSAVPVTFECVIPAGKQAVITRVMFRILDNSAPSITEFGGGTALTNGLIIRAVDTDLTTVLYDYTANSTIKCNGDIALLTGGSDTVFFTGTGDDAVFGRWTLSKALGTGLLLTAGQSFDVVVQDNLTGLTGFEIRMQGRVYDA